MTLNLYVKTSNLIEFYKLTVPIYYAIYEYQNQWKQKGQSTGRNEQRAPHPQKPSTRKTKMNIELGAKAHGKTGKRRADRDPQDHTPCEAACGTDDHQQKKYKNENLKAIGLIYYIYIC